MALVNEKEMVLAKLSSRFYHHRYLHSLIGIWNGMDLLEGDKGLEHESECLQLLVVACVQQERVLWW